MLGIDDANAVALTYNATHALNLAFLGLELKKGARVITTVMEHNSVLRPLSHLKKRRGIEVITIGLDGEGNLDRESFEGALRGGAALVAMTHASNVTGMVNDVAYFFSRAHDQGAFTLLDASQSMGHIPVIPHILGADLVAFTGHKGLLGPPGSGGLYVKPGLELEHYYVGGTGVRSDLEFHPDDMPTRLEAGTPGMAALAGLACALSWLEQHGDSHGEKEKELSSLFRHELKKTDGLVVYDAREGAGQLPVFSFVIKGWSVEEAGYVLHESFGIIGRTGLHCAPLIHGALGTAPGGTIRLSLSGFTTGDEIEQVLQALGRMAR
jgi:selenocysteine lyase/cysteine desulfurase